MQPGLNICCNVWRLSTLSCRPQVAYIRTLHAGLTLSCRPQAHANSGPVNNAHTQRIGRHRRRPRGNRYKAQWNGHCRGRLPSCCYGAVWRLAAHREYHKVYPRILQATRWIGVSPRAILISDQCHHSITKRE